MSTPFSVLDNGTLVIPSNCIVNRKLWSDINRREFEKVEVKADAKIEPNAFNGFENLQSVILHGGVQVASNSFDDNFPKLTQVTISTKTVMKDRAFKFCKALKELRIVDPSYMETTCQKGLRGSFYLCHALDTVVFDAKPFSFEKLNKLQMLNQFSTESFRVLDGFFGLFCCAKYQVGNQLFCSRMQVGRVPLQMLDTRLVNGEVRISDFSGDSFDINVNSPPNQPCNAVLSTNPDNYLKDLVMQQYGTVNEDIKLGKFNLYDETKLTLINSANDLGQYLLRGQNNVVLVYSEPAEGITSAFTDLGK